MRLQSEQESELPLQSLDMKMRFCQRPLDLIFLELRRPSEEIRTFCGKRRVDDDVTHGCHRIRCEATASSRDRDFCRVMASTTSRLRIWLGWADINDGIQFQLTSSSSAHFKSTYPNLRTKRCSTVSLFDRRYIISQRVSAFHRYCHHRLSLSAGRGTPSPSIHSGGENLSKLKASKRQRRTCFMFAWNTAKSERWPILEELKAYWQRNDG